MEWPSQRIPQGGVFHTAKVQYSPDTKNFLKLLMDESKMTSMQRQRINYSLRSGDPLPTFRSSTHRSSRDDTESPALTRTGPVRKRSKFTIAQSGAYERERFVPDNSKPDRENLKRQLQEAMAGGKDGKNCDGKPKPKSKAEEPKCFNKFDQLVKEIEDRQNWLKEMEELGEAHKHRDVINLQIEARLREMQKLKLSTDDDVSGD